MEKQLIQKTFYETFLETHTNSQPITVLGEIFMQEQQNDMPDLSYIRFAQGEVYFHNKDYEAAIFKWENIVNELEPWAKKNIADAYYQLRLLSMAEDVYKTIQSDNLILNTEVALNLFSLYIEREKQESALYVLKSTVAQNPDYPNVTDIAKSFFEEQQDWNNAVELAVNEAIRTKSMEWFECLKGYIDQGFTKKLAPNYFSECLTVLYLNHPLMFEKMVSSIWNSYKGEESYFSWLKEINQLLINIDFSHQNTWRELSFLFHETFMDIIDGRYLIKAIQEIVPILLSNWLRLADGEEVLLASTAVLSWSELFPSSILIEIIREAEEIFSQTENHFDKMEECQFLLQSILEWIQDREIVGGNQQLEWIAAKIADFHSENIFIVGQSGSGKSSFIHFVVGDESSKGIPTSTMVLYKHGSRLEIEEINENEMVELSGRTEFYERMNRRRHALESIFEFRSPNSFLYENGISLIDTPSLNGTEAFKYLPVADSLLYVIDVSHSFTEKDKEILTRLKELVPDISIHFILHKMDTIQDEQEAIRIYDETRLAVLSYFPDAMLFAFSAQYERSKQLSDLNEFVKSIKIGKNLEEKRVEKFLAFIRSTITGLLQKRIDVENHLIESVRWNEEIVMKLNGAINQLHDMESEKTKILTRKFYSIREEILKNINETIPKLLQDCSKLIKEDSNLSKIHLVLNQEMNNRIENYIKTEALTRYFDALKEWLIFSKEELSQAQNLLYEMGEGFNTMYGESRLSLDGDMKIIDDWHRDIDRMTSSFHMDEVNILLRNTPLQLILKSAGRLLGAFSQNNTVLYNKYKTFVESEDYLETVQTISRQFFQPFELFEKSLERDLVLFFRNPLSVLKNAVENSREEIQTNEEMLKTMNQNPEMYRDPLTLFEVRLRQLEWLSLAGHGIQLRV